MYCAQHHILVFLRVRISRTSRIALLGICPHLVRSIRFVMARTRTVFHSLRVHPPSPDDISSRTVSDVDLLLNSVGVPGARTTSTSRSTRPTCFRPRLSFNLPTFVYARSFHDLVTLTMSFSLRSYFGFWSCCLRSRSSRFAIALARDSSSHFFTLRPVLALHCI